MCLLIIEIVMFVSGLYALIAGRMRLTHHLNPEGWRARVTGAFLVAPLLAVFLTELPLVLLAGPGPGNVVRSASAYIIGMPGFFEGQAGLLGLPEFMKAFTIWIELGSVLAGLVGAVVFALVSRPRGVAVPPRERPSSPGQI